MLPCAATGQVTDWTFDRVARVMLEKVLLVLPGSKAEDLVGNMSHPYCFHAVLLHQIQTHRALEGRTRWFPHAQGGDA